jgi:hypothetical protein
VRSKDALEIQVYIPEGPCSAICRVIPFVLMKRCVISPIKTDQKTFTYKNPKDWRNTKIKNEKKSFSLTLVCF